MKLLKNTLLVRLINCVKSKFQDKPCSLRNELFISGVTKTHLFAKMTIQDQIISLSRLIDMFQRDHGFIPERPSKVLIRLNNELNSQVLANFSKYQ